jgi:hypothetical protein
MCQLCILARTFAASSAAAPQDSLVFDLSQFVATVEAASANEPRAIAVSIHSNIQPLSK